MSERIFVKPADGVKVRKPDTLEHVKPEGEFVVRSTYYTRRIADGDLIEGGPAKAEAPAKKAE